MYFYIEQWVNGLTKPPLNELGLRQRLYISCMGYYCRWVKWACRRIVCFLGCWKIQISLQRLLDPAWAPIPSWLPSQAEPPETSLVSATFCLLLFLLSRSGPSPPIVSCCGVLSHIHLSPLAGIKGTSNRSHQSISCSHLLLAAHRYSLSLLGPPFPPSHIPFLGFL